MKTIVNPNKINLDYYKEEDNKHLLPRLLDSVKINNDDFLTKSEQDFYVDEISYLITGQRHSKAEVLADIVAGSADIDDIGN